MLAIVQTLASMDLIMVKHAVGQRFPSIRLDTETEFINDALKADPALKAHFSKD